MYPDDYLKLMKVHELRLVSTYRNSVRKGINIILKVHVTTGHDSVAGLSLNVKDFVQHVAFTLNSQFGQSKSAQHNRFNERLREIDS
jgi:hypothetical protein